MEGKEMKAEKQFELINNALINVHTDYEFPFDTYLMDICVIARESGDFDTKLEANRLYYALDSLFFPNGTRCFFYGNNLYLIWHFNLYKNGIKVAKDTIKDWSIPETFNISLFDIAFCGFNIFKNYPTPKEFSDSFKKLNTDIDRWEKWILLRNEYQYFFDLRIPKKRVRYYFDEIKIKGLPKNDIFYYVRMLDEIEAKKNYNGIAQIMIVARYIKDATDPDIENIIVHQKLLNGSDPIEWTGRSAHVFDFLDCFNMKLSIWEKCFILSDNRKITGGNKSKRKVGYQSELVNKLKIFK